MKAIKHGSIWHDLMLDKPAHGESDSVLWLAAAGLLLAILFIVWCLSSGRPIIFYGN